MEQFFERLHVRKESVKRIGLSKREQWKEDETMVRHGSCDFRVKYLGYTEILEAKGTEICKQSFHKLKYNELGSPFASLFQKQKASHRTSTASCHYATLHISGDGIRVADDNDEVLVYTPVASVSFCCPNFQHERGFTYICIADVPWKWNCHAMEAVEDSGERLNHAVGCAFAICFERKMLSKYGDRKTGAQEDAAAAEQQLEQQQQQQRQQQQEQGHNSFPSSGFVQVHMTERQADPQAVKVADPVPRRYSDTTAYPSIDRPKGPDELKGRKGHLGVIMEAHPYKRQPTRKEEEVELRSDSDK